jgi:hypothetical protein
LRSAERPPEWGDTLLYDLEKTGRRILVEVAADHVQILGIPSDPSVSMAARVEPSSIQLDAQEIVLRTKKSMIVLRANGDIELLGIRILSRARAEQKLMAPMLKLN